uniref:Uncharacterized protein n=1 Tax=Glossina austeni TaxID=7395 RepID=A0A1A9UNY3_GLOAU
MGGQKTYVFLSTTTTIDEIGADFDVNLDRITQIELLPVLLLINRMYAAKALAVEFRHEMGPKYLINIISFMNFFTLLAYRGHNVKLSRTVLLKLWIDVSLWLKAPHRSNLNGEHENMLII